MKSRAMNGARPHTSWRGHACEPTLLEGNLDVLRGSIAWLYVGTPLPAEFHRVRNPTGSSPILGFLLEA